MLRPIPDDTLLTFDLSGRDNDPGRRLDRIKYGQGVSVNCGGSHGLVLFGVEGRNMRRLTLIRYCLHGLVQPDRA